jgi:RHS repeat-associated protein
MNGKISSMKIIGIGLVVFGLLCGSVFGQEDTKNNKDKTSRSNATVNPTSLGLELSIPLSGVSGRAGNSLPIAFNYSSKVWRMETQSIRTTPGVPPDTYAIPIYSEDSDSGWTTSLQAPYLEGSSIVKTVQPDPTPTPSQCSGYPNCTFGTPTPTPLPYPTPNPSCDAQVGGQTYHCDYCQLDDDGNPIFGSGCQVTTHTSLTTTANAHYVIPKYTLHLPDGSTHELVSQLGAYYVPANQSFPNPTKYFSIDGSNLRYESGILYMPNGSRYEFGGDTNTYIVNYFDADGNKLTYSVNRNGNYTIANLIRRGKWTDTLGRTISSPKPPVDPTNTMQPFDIVPGNVEYNVPTLPNQLPMTYIFRWKPLENSFAYSSTHPNYSVKRLSELFSDVAIGNYHNPVVLQEIEQPNGKKYQFFYNDHGEIEKIIYPTGSSEEFIYEPIAPFSYATGLGSNNPLIGQGNRGVTKRTVMPDNVEAHNMVWKYSVETSPYRITTKPPLENETTDLSKTVRYLFIAPQSSNSGTPTLPSQMGGKPYEEQSYDRAGKLVSRSLTKWMGATPPAPPPSGGGGCPGGCGGNGNDFTTTNGSPSSSIISYPRVEKQISISVEGSNALATMSESEYDANADAMFFAQMNVKRAKSYGYVPLNSTQALNSNFATIQALFTPDKLLGSSETDYLYDAAYKARGILGLPIESRSYYKNDPIPISKTQTVFDESQYLVADSGALSGLASNTWINPSTTLRGKPTTSQVLDATGNVLIATHTQYDQYGNVRKTFTPSSVPNVDNVSEVIYSADYACAYPTKTISPAPSADGTHGTTATSEATMKYDYTTGLPLEVTDEYNQTIKTEYDAYLRPKKVSGVYPFVIPITETFYDDVNLSWVKVRKQIDEQNWDEATTFTDSLGRTIKTQAKDSQGDVVTETKYDNLGRVEKTSNPYRVNASGYPIDCPPNNPTQCIYWSKPRYDELNRVVETFAPAKEGEPQVSLGITEFGISTVQDYVGTYTTATDASGRRARSITNALGQLVRIDEPKTVNGNVELGSLDLPLQPTYYKYNPQGKMVKVSQGQQNRYFLYDYLGRLIRVRQPEQEVNSLLNTTQTIDGNNEWTAAMEYDLVGNLIKTTDAENKQITNTYDKAGRVKVRSYSNLDTPSVYYYYDGTGLGTVPAYSKGKLTKVSSTISASLFTSFDNFGRVLAHQQITDNQTYDTAYKYNLSGALLEEKYPSGKVVRNFLESDGDLAKVVRNGKVYASDFLFTASGGIKSLKLGNGRFETAEFNARQQVTQIGLGSTVAANDLWKVNYSYGELAANGTDVVDAKNTGNIAKQVITIPNATFTQTYRYDSLNRITEAKETAANNAITWQQSWSYDRFGNRLSFNSQGIDLATINTTPAVNPETNRFISTQDFGYDKTGNIIKDKINGNTRNFVFNGDNKQVHVKDANNVAIGTYYYDGNGARVKKTVGGNTTIFVYDVGGVLIAEYSTEVPTTTPTTNYTTSDHLGSPRVITDKNGQVISRRDFMPFGEELNAVGNFRTITNKYGSATDNVRQRFTGYLKDQETQLDFAEARYYNNNHGRFTAVDPLLASGKSSNPQTFNRYVYCLNNPINCVDPTGLDGVWGYRDVNGGTDLQYFESQEAFDAHNKRVTDQNCGSVGCGTYTLYKGGNFFLWADKTVSYLGGDGSRYDFAYSQPDDHEIDASNWGNLVGSFHNGSFSSEQIADLEGRMGYEKQVQSRMKAIEDGLDQIDRFFDVERQCKENNQACSGGFSVRQAKNLLTGAEKIAERAASVIAKYKGVETEGGWLFKNARTAKKAAAEIAGDMGSATRTRSLSEFRGGPKWATRSNKIWERLSRDGSIRVRNDIFGHNYGNGNIVGPHINVEFKLFELNYHLFY